MCNFFFYLSTTLFLPPTTQRCYSGANQYIGATEWAALQRHLTSPHTKIVSLGMDTDVDVLCKTARLARMHGKTVVLGTTASLSPCVESGGLKRLCESDFFCNVDIFICNACDVSLLLNGYECRSLADCMAACFDLCSAYAPVKNVIVVSPFGVAVCLTFHDVVTSYAFVVPPIRVRMEDSAYAVDVFRGAFVARLLQQWTKDEAVIFAAACMALVLSTDRVDTSSLPREEELEQFMKSKGVAMFEIERSNRAQVDEVMPRDEVKKSSMSIIKVKKKKKKKGVVYVVFVLCCVYVVVFDFCLCIFFTFVVICCHLL